MDNVIIFFRYINGKDIFEAFYRKHFAKRLLVGKMINTELENLMISKLKVECGSRFTSYLEGMFNDVKISKDIMRDFRESNELSVDMNVTVLTTGTWPNFTLVDVNLPTIFLEGQKIFEEFYIKKYNGRKLTWQPYMANCSLTSRFPSGDKTITMSLLQAIIMLQFNDASKRTYKELKESTGISMILKKILILFFLI